MYDVVVVGGGIAGLRAAVAAQAQGASVALISRTNPTRSYSVTIQDGMNAALGTGDSAEQHAQDTVQAGGYLADQALVAQICSEAPAAVEELDRMGTPFNRSNGAALDLAGSVGSSQARSAFADDMTGHVVTQVLYEQSLKAQVKAYDEWVAVDLAMDDGKVIGVVALQLSTGKLESIGAKAVVLATGGPRRLYDPSTASLHCSGDGIALAYRAGAALADMEMVQYHPYVVNSTRMALSELLVGATPQVFTADKSALADGTGSAGMVRSMARAISEGKGTDGALLVQPVLEDAPSDRFFNTRTHLSGLTGIKLSDEPLPVRPAMHRLLGGIAVDGQGATSIPGLYAAGEAAGAGFHGACGLEGNFITTSVVLGKHAGEAAADYGRGQSGNEPGPAYAERVTARRREVLDRKSTHTVAGLRNELAALMHQHAGVERSAENLQTAAQDIDRIDNAHAAAGVNATGLDFNFAYLHHLELGYLLDIARAVTASAKAREESRGVHYRTDFPQTDNANWTKRTIAQRGDDGSAQIEYRAVDTSRWQPA